MHDLDRLVGKFVGLDDALYQVRFILTNKGDSIQTMPADHFHNETALSLIGLILNVALAAFHSSVFVSYITQTTFENREKSLINVNDNSEHGIRDVAHYFIIQLACKARFDIISGLLAAGENRTELVLVEKQISIKREGSISRFGGIQGGKDQLKCFVSCMVYDPRGREKSRTLSLRASKDTTSLNFARHKTAS